MDAANDYAPATSHLERTVDIVSAYVTKNSVRVDDLPSLIGQVHAALSNLGKPEAKAVEATPLTPAVPVKKSIQPDHLVCLEDGKKFKSLKRHLTTAYGMTPDEYRAKWGLARDYPMVAPNYAAARSALAKNMGLGRKAPDEAERARAA